MKALQIGKAIKDILSKGGIKNAYPLIADAGTTFPFIVYRRSSFTPASTKDRFNYKYDVMVELAVAAATYADSVTLADQVAELMEKTNGTYKDIEINDITIIDGSEEYSEQDAFIQKLTFNIEIK